MSTYFVSVHPDGSLSRVGAGSHLDAAQRHVGDMMQTREYRPAEHGTIRLQVEHEAGGVMIYRVTPGPTGGAIVKFDDDENLYDDDGDDDFSLDPDDEAVNRGEAY